SRHQAEKRSALLVWWRRSLLSRRAAFANRIGDCHHHDAATDAEHGLGRCGASGMAAELHVSRTAEPASKALARNAPVCTSRNACAETPPVTSTNRTPSVWFTGRGGASSLFGAQHGLASISR